MAKKIKDSDVEIQDEEQVIIDPVIRPIIIDPIPEPIEEEKKYSMDTFLDENIKTSKSSSTRAGFKVWYTRIKNFSILDKKIIREWEVLLNEFNNRKIK
jgi:hypothetical protein